MALKKAEESTNPPKTFRLFIAHYASIIPLFSRYLPSFPAKSRLFVGFFISFLWLKQIKVFTDPDELILSYNPELHGAPLFMGMDVGRTHDATVFYIIGNHNGKKKSVARIEMRNAEFDAQRDVFRKLMKNLPIYRSCIDDGGLGKDLAEAMTKEFSGRAEKYHFDMYSKEVLAMSVKTGLERREFLLENDREFHSQIHSIKRTPTSGGSFRYDAERNEKGHADSFWAWALASYATNGKRLNRTFTPNMLGKRTIQW